MKKLGTFRKERHTVPDAVNPATEAFFARLCAEDVAGEGEHWFQRAREAFGYKRREVSLEVSAASALVIARDFSLEVNWKLCADDPGSYTITRTLRDVRDLEFVMAPACDAVFAGTFTDIVFALARGVAVESVIDAVEALPDEGALSVEYPSSCAECTLTVEGVAASVRCTGATLELGFPRAGSPRELLESFAEVRAAFRLTRDAALASLL